MLINQGSFECSGILVHILLGSQLVVVRSAGVCTVQTRAYFNVVVLCVLLPGDIYLPFNYGLQRLLNSQKDVIWLNFTVVGGEIPLALILGLL